MTGVTTRPQTTGPQADKVRGLVVRGPVVPSSCAWQVTVQRPQVPGDAGYVQVDDFSEGNRWSKGPAELRAEGYTVPDFSLLPTGRYSWEQALAFVVVS